MSGDPGRLIDDPNFLWETGCDLADEASAVGSYDLQGMRSAVLSKVQQAAGADGVVPGVSSEESSGATGGVVARWLIGAGLGALVVGAAFWLGTQQGVPTEVPPPRAVPVEAPRLAPSAVAPAVGTDDDEVVEPPAVEEVAQLSVERRPAPPRSPSPAAPSKPSLAPSEGAMGASEAPTAAPEGTAEAPVGEPVGLSQIGAELRSYEPAKEALDAGEHERAIDLFREYLDFWPRGQMRQAAEIGLLQALFGAGDAQGTAELAAALADDPRHQFQSLDIRTLHAESLVLLDRCTEAGKVAEQLPSKLSNSIRRACRKR